MVAKYITIFFVSDFQPKFEPASDWPAESNNSDYQADDQANGTNEPNKSDTYHRPLLQCAAETSLDLHFPVTK